MITVNFKDNYSNMYGSKDYIYNDFEGIEVGDIAVVNTAQGFAIARVSRINVEASSVNVDIAKIQNVEKIIKTKKQIDIEEKAAYEKKVKMQQFANEAKRKSLLGFISGFSADAELLKEIASWSTKELEILARMID